MKLTKDATFSEWLEVFQPSFSALIKREDVDQDKELKNQFDDYYSDYCDWSNEQEATA